MAHVLLSLLLVLHLAALPACTGAAPGRISPDLTSLSHLLGQQASICHHSETDGQPAPDPHDRCCDACILCHVLSSGTPPAPDLFSLAAPTSFARVAFDETHTIDVAYTNFIGASGPRGPPLGI